MRIYLQDLDLDVWIYVECGVINDNIDKQYRKEIMRGLSNSYIKKVICFKIAKEIWDKL